jgi:hypothetical protein
MNYIPPLGKIFTSLHWEFYAMGVNDEAIFSQQYFHLCCGPYLQLPELVEYFSAG